MDGQELLKKIEELEIKTLTQKELNEFTQEQLLRQKEQMLREDALSMERRQFEQSLSQGERTAPVTTAEDDMFSDSEQALETKEEKKQVKKVKKSKDLFHFEENKEERIHLSEHREDFVKQETAERHYGTKEEHEAALDEANGSLIMIETELQSLRDKAAQPGIEEDKRKEIDAEIAKLEKKLDDEKKLVKEITDDMNLGEKDLTQRRKVFNLLQEPQKTDKASKFTEQFMMYLMDENITIPWAGAEKELASITFGIEEFEPEHVVANFAQLQEKLKRIKALCELFEQGTEEYNYLTSTNKGLVIAYSKVLPLAEDYFDAVMATKGLVKKDGKKYEKGEITDTKQYLDMARARYNQIKDAFSMKDTYVAEQVEEKLVSINDTTRPESHKLHYLEGKGKVVESIPVLTMSQYSDMKKLQDLVAEKLESAGESKEVVKKMFADAMSTMTAMTSMIRKIDALDGFRAKFTNVYMSLLVDKIENSQSEEERQKYIREKDDFSGLISLLSDDEAQRLNDEYQLIKADRDLTQEEKLEKEKKLKEKYEAYVAEKDEQQKKEFEKELNDLLEKTGRKIEDMSKPFGEQMAEIIKRMTEDQKKAEEQELAEAAKQEKQPAYLDAKRQMGLGLKGKGSEAAIFQYSEKLERDKAGLLVAPFEDSVKSVFELMKVRREQLARIKDRFSLLSRGIEFLLGGTIEGKQKSAVLLMLAKDYQVKFKDGAIETKLLASGEIYGDKGDLFTALLAEKTPSYRGNKYISRDGVLRLKPLFDLISKDEGKKNILSEILTNYELLYKEKDKDKITDIRKKIIEKYAGLAVFVSGKIRELGSPAEEASMSDDKRKQLYRTSEYVMAFEQLEKIIGSEKDSSVFFTKAEKESIEENKAFREQILSLRRQDRYKILIEAYEAGIDTKVYLTSEELKKIAKVNHVKTDAVDSLMIYKYCKKGLSITQINETALTKGLIESTTESQKQKKTKETDDNQRHKTFWDTWKSVCEKYKLNFSSGMFVNPALIQSAMVLCEENTEDAKKERAKLDGDIQQNAQFFLDLDNVEKDAAVTHKLNELTKESALLKVAFSLCTRRETGEGDEKKTVEPLIADMVTLCTREGMEDAKSVDIRQMIWEIAGVGVGKVVEEGSPAQKEMQKSGMKKYKEKMYGFYEKIDSTFGHEMPPIEILISNSALLEQIMAGLKMDIAVVSNEEVVEKKPKDEMLMHRVHFYGAMAQIYQLIKDMLGLGKDMSEIRTAEEYKQLKETMKTHAAWFITHAEEAPEQ